MDHIALGEQQFGQIGAVLPRRARDQGGSSHGMVPFSGALASRDRLPRPVDCLPPAQRRISAVAGFGDDSVVRKIRIPQVNRAWDSLDI